MTAAPVARAGAAPPAARAGAAPPAARAGVAPPLLYVHPLGHLNDLVIPAGAVSCLNGVAVPKLGRYAFEVTDDEIRGARVVAMDVHWALALPGFARLVRHVRRLNPAAAVVVGGITAGHWAEELTDPAGADSADFAIRGDAEVAFARLVTALLAGRDVVGIPNLVGRGVRTPLRRRMTPAEFDATDSLTVAWFPTYAQLTDWDAQAFGMGRTISVLRGCPLRCPTCYGSYAATFGAGFLARSPARLAAEVRRAADLGVRNLRLVAGKPPPRVLTALLRGLAAGGPYRFANTVGLYLCTPPADEDLDALEAAFAGRVTLSVVPPEEHAPALPLARRAAELAAWRRVAARVARSRGLSLDVWATATDETTRLRRSLGVGTSPRVVVSLGSVWHVTRPTDTGPRARLAETRAAMEPSWTFWVGRLLSPALATLLAPFRFLDELAADPGAIPRPAPPLDGFYDLAMASWRRHHLPTMPGLAFSLLPLRRRPGAVAGRAGAGVHFRGAMGRWDAAAFTRPRGARPTPLVTVPLVTKIDHAGVRLCADGLRVTPPADLLAFVPHPPGGTPDAAWIAALAPFGFAALALPAGASAGARGALTLKVTLRVQEVDVVLLTAAGAPLARGRVDLAFFRPPPRGARPAGA